MFVFLSHKDNTTTTLFKPNKKLHDTFRLRLTERTTDLTIELYSVATKPCLSKSPTKIATASLSLGSSDTATKRNSKHSVKLGTQFTLKLITCVLAADSIAHTTLTQLVKELGQHNRDEFLQKLTEASLEEESMTSLSVAQRRAASQLLFGQLRLVTSLDKLPVLVRVYVSLHTCELSLKYELNDLAGKLASRTGLTDSASASLAFLDALPARIFSAQDLFALSKRFFEAWAPRESGCCFRDLGAFELSAFAQNYQFRNKLVEYWILNYLSHGLRERQREADDDDCFGAEEITLISRIIAFRYSAERYVLKLM